MTLRIKLNYVVNVDTMEVESLLQVTYKILLYIHMQRRYLSIKQASEIIGVTPLTLRNWDKKGKLRPFRNPVNGYRYYRIDQIEAFLRAMESSREKYRKLKIDVF